MPNDETDRIHESLRRQIGGHAGWIVRLRHLDEVHANHNAELDHALEAPQHVVIAQAAMAWCTDPGRDGWVEPIDTNSELKRGLARDTFHHTLCTPSMPITGSISGPPHEPPHRPLRWTTRRYKFQAGACANLRQLRCTSQRIATPESGPHGARRQSQGGHRKTPCATARAERMLASLGHGPSDRRQAPPQCAGIDNAVKRALSISVTRARVGVRDVCIPNIGNAYLIVTSISRVTLKFVCTTVVKGEQGGHFTDCPWSLMRTAAPLAAHIVGDASHRNIYLNVLPSVHGAAVATVQCPPNGRLSHPTS